MKVKKECKICKTLTTNKVYCSEKCQHEGYRKIKSDRVIGVCMFCNIEFIYLHSMLIRNGKPKPYCSRQCKDSHSSILYSGENSPNFGIKFSEERCKMQSENTAKSWKNPEHRNKRLIGLQMARDQSDYPLGWSPEAKQKRIETNISIFGVPNNFCGIYGKRPGDITFFEKHGMSSIDYCRKKLIENKKEKTNIEQIVETLLIKHNINYEFQYNFKNRYFDFLLPEYNILIECDGDYHHGNGIADENLTELQLRSRKNDQYKNSLVKNSNTHTLIRFWGSEIENKNFESVFINLWQK